MSNKILVIGTAVVALALAEISYGTSASSVESLTTQEIVAQAKSSVVAIIEENSTTGEYWEGTGWFITPNRIVTNEHVISKPFDRMRIVNVATLKHYTLDHVAYSDATSDVAVIVVKEESASHLNLSKLTPISGMEVVVIGNPLGQPGTVTIGTITDVFNFGVDKRTNAIYLEAGLQEGESGSPVLDSNGDVLGMVWGAGRNKHGEGAAVTVNTLKLAQVDIVDMMIAAAPPQPAPRAVPRALPVDRKSMAEIAEALNDKIFFAGAHLGMTIGECATYYEKIADDGSTSWGGSPDGEKLLDFRTRRDGGQLRVLVCYRSSDGKIVSVVYWKAGDGTFSAEEMNYLIDLNRGRLGVGPIISHLYDGKEFEVTTPEQDKLEGSAP